MEHEQNARIESRNIWLNRVDPVYRFLDQWLLAGLFRPRNAEGGSDVLPRADTEFLVDNLKKHRWVLWSNIVLAVYLAVSGLRAIAANGDPAVVVTGLLAPAMITGAAWYTISFGGVPEKFLSLALTLTGWMFLSFTLSMTLLTGLLCYITPWPVGLFVITPIYLSLYIASVLYDSLDGLKVGLDSTLLKFSRATLSYYEKHGYVTREESLADQYEGTRSEDITNFTHYIKMLEQTVSLLGEDKDLKVANRLVASATDLVFQIVEISSPDELERGAGYGDYVTGAHNMKLDQCDEATIRYLKRAIDGLEVILGAEANDNIVQARQTLTEFESLRDEKERKGEERNGDTDQKLADYLFVQVFQQLLSLMQAHRQKFFTKTAKR